MPRDIKTAFPPETQQNVHIAVYVPSTRIDKPINSTQLEKRVRDTVNKLDQLFGGTTRIRGTGSYHISRTRSIEEPVVIVETFAEKQKYSRKKGLLQKWLAKKFREWKQLSLGWEFEEELHSVEPDPNNKKKIVFT